MEVSRASDWHQNNLNFIKFEIARIRDILEKASDGNNARSRPPNSWSGSSLNCLCEKFNLSAFERDILLLCLALELEPEISSLYAKIQGESKKYPTLNLALSYLPYSNFQVISQSYPLLKWQLLEVLPNYSFTLAPIRLDKRIFSYILGVPEFDEKLIEIIRPIPKELEANSLPNSQLNIVDNLVNIWSNDSNGKTNLQLCGREIYSKYAIAARVCNNLNLNLFVLQAERLPTKPNELEKIRRRWEREAILTNSVLLLDCDEIEAVNKLIEIRISSFIESLDVPLIISSYERRATRYRPLISFDVPSLSYLESKSVWVDNLGERAAQLNGQLERVASQFNLSPHGIEATCYSVKTNDKNGNSLSDNLWNACRISARPKLDNLAQRIESDATWEDLIIPKEEKDLLKDIAIQVKQKQKVYQEWGFSSQKRGLGITALFHGTSGTGKTMAAEVIANTLNLDLYRIDLSSVVSKYIGETEKNLRKIFDAAETGGAVLLFDEADAIFGKRTQVKDSHDRHANIEVSYLLQRMESYQGLAILTTNFKENLDRAFSRRIRFMVKFGFPDTESRSKIWQRIFPAQTPTSGLNFKKLGNLSVTGGVIKNIALNAAFIAAEANEAVMMKHLLYATQKEFIKLERSISDFEIKGWVEKK